MRADCIHYSEIYTCRFLNTPQRNERLRQLHSKARLTNQHIRRMERRLQEAIERRGIETDDILHQDLTTIMAENSSGVKEQHPPGSFPRIFWEQQERASKLKNAKSMRWEPAMIRFDICCSHVIHSAYSAMNSTQMVYIHATPLKFSLRVASYLRDRNTAISENST